MFVLGGELSSRFERQELDVGGAVHVIRSRNRLRHENASGRALQFPQCPPKAEFAVWQRRVLLVPPFLSPFLVYRIDSQITAHCCTVCCFGWDRQDAGGHSQLFWRQTVAGEPEPKHASEKGCGMGLFILLRSPLPSFSSIVIALVFYQPHRCPHYQMVANRRITRLQSGKVSKKQARGARRIIDDSDDEDYDEK